MTQRMVLYLGLDPGASGAAAVLGWAGGTDRVRVLGLHPLAKLGGEQDLLDLLTGYAARGRAHGGCRALLERVGGFIGGRAEERLPTGQGKRNFAAAHTMFRFGQSYGTLRGLLTATLGPDGEYWSTIRPQDWQAALSVPPRRKRVRGQPGSGETPAQWKSRLKTVAQGLFPGAKVTKETADALLLAEVCRRQG